MPARIARATKQFGALLREIGSSMRGVMPPLRSSDGTFGTLRAQAKARAADRERYPTD